MPDITLIDLSKYRLAKAAETLETVRRDMNAEDFASANHRAYYSKICPQELERMMEL